MDKGPWEVIERWPHAIVGSGDFSRDVWLQVSGDFKDDADRLAYCEWLASVLNGATAARE